MPQLIPPGRASPKAIPEGDTEGMDLQLSGKLALVTGSTAGIGFAIASALAAEGAIVLINGRTEARVAEAIHRLRSALPHAEVRPLVADLGSAEGAAQTVEAVPDLDILVNNLGIFEPKAFEEITDSDWSRFFEVNVMSGVRLSRAYLGKMKEKNWGRIVFISSESAVQIPSEMIHYGFTKTAQLSISRGLAELTAGTGVTVNAVLPGPTSSEGVSQFVDDMAASKGIGREQVEEDFFRTIRPSSLIQRFATVEEVANLVAYVCSPRSAATNGAALRADGGIIRSIV
jgi:NAD(P)-dependent dehydrogenase (short-subunit alcohol dehydrogenase family)